MRVQFFPDSDLESILNADAASRGLSVSVLVDNLLIEYYGLGSTNRKTEDELEIDVLNEIADFIAEPLNANIDEFDLNFVSATYRQISMIYSGRPSIVKARIGRKFNSMVGTPGMFANIEQIFLPNNGKPKRSENNAALYKFTDGRSRIELNDELDELDESGNIDEDIFFIPFDEMDIEVENLRDNVWGD